MYVCMLQFIKNKICLNLIFLTFKCFSKIRWTVDSDMPTFRAISPTVNLASPSMISFILETVVYEMQILAYLI